MTDQELNVLIAERRGWRRDADSWRSPNGGRWAILKGNRVVPDRDIIPNYCGDLNPIHEAVMAQPQAVRDKINMRLIESLREEDAHILDRTINATARQRAEAFVEGTNP